ncbi:enoyl-CoA hydratase/isomerase family protein [Deminuibacter soli]|uniref:Enoyl-CoA hydratase n=1 Tax=Deminuibacter soli TaxID=2291815 RepID=A0A3E1NP28_9BACT|nr:enoyl-CoA hydratase-related protein [Deminuibacter soli]RFM29691.1 enoyl-CoA hydratase [Deminuibacter soli]
MPYQTLLTGLSDGIFTIIINRADKLNALNTTVMQELGEAFDEIYADPAVKSVIITGAGPKAFVAGADISEFVGLSVAEGSALAQRGHDLFFKIERCPKPVVACVNGFALGGGCELAMSCHFRIASSNAKFGQPEVNLGIIPGYGGTQRLTRLIGKGRAMELILSANMIDAATALQYGLVNYVVEPEQLILKAQELLITINSKAPLALAAAIKAINAVYDETTNGFETEVLAFGDCFATEDMKEGASAFLEKRKAVFTGK